MQPGRELDALVAQHVLDWSPSGASWRNEDYDGPSLVPPDPSKAKHDSDGFPRLPYFSTDITAAWEVVGKLDGREFELTREWFETKKSWRFRAVFKDALPASADDAPHAICLAALKACGVEL